MEQNKSMYTKKDLKLANNAIKLYHALGRPGYKVFYNILQRGLILNCKINAQISTVLMKERYEKNLLE